MSTTNLLRRTPKRPASHLSLFDFSGMEIKKKKGVPPSPSRGLPGILFGQDMSLAKRTSDRHFTTRAEDYTHFLEHFRGRDLAQFRGLCNARSFARGTRVLQSKATLLNDMISWQLSSIPRPLINFTPQQCGSNRKANQLRRLATDLFVDIQSFMRDRFHSMPNSVGYSVVKRGFEEPFIRDEIYCQIIKQTTRNPNSPNTDSSVYGWKLFLACVQSFLPSTQLIPYIKAHVARNGPSLYADHSNLGFETVSDLALRAYFALLKLELVGSASLLEESKWDLILQTRTAREVHSKSSRQVKSLTSSRHRRASSAGEKKSFFSPKRELRGPVEVMSSISYLDHEDDLRDMRDDRETISSLDTTTGNSKLQRLDSKQRTKKSILSRWKIGRKKSAKKAKKAEATSVKQLPLEPWEDVARKPRTRFSISEKKKS